MNRGWRILVAVLVGVAFGAALWTLFLGRSRPLVCRESQDGWRFHTGQLPPHQVVGQTFSSRLDDLARIEVKLGTFRRTRVDDLSLELIEIPDSRVPDPARPWPMVDEGIALAVFDQIQLGQTFIPLRGGLTGIWLWVDTTRLPPRAGVRLQIRQAGVIDLPGPLLATSWADKEELPAQGFHLFGFPPLETVGGTRLLLNVSVRGAPGVRRDLPHPHPRDPTFGWQIDNYLMVRFLSDKGRLDGRPWNRSYPGGETWRPEVSIGRSYSHLEKGQEDFYNRRFPWEYWKGDLVFAPAYRPVLDRGQVLRRDKRPGWTISDNKFNSFSFDPVSGSKGKSYYFRLVPSQEGKARAVALADWAPRYPAGVLVVDGVPYRGGLAFRAYSALPRQEALDRFLGRLVKNKPGLPGRAAAIRILALAHLVLASVLIGLLTFQGLGRRRKT